MVFVLAIFVSGAPERTPARVPESLLIKDTLPVLYPTHDYSLYPEPARPPFLGTCVIGFREALAFKESRGNYFVTNTLGYLGKYQFGIGTLRLMGVYNPANFLKKFFLKIS